MEGKQKKGRKMYQDDSSSFPNTQHQDNPLGIHSQIAEHLRAFYSSIQEEAMPERFLNLLEKLDEAEQNTTTACKDCSEPESISAKNGGDDA